MKIFKMRQDVFKQHCDEHDGICLACSGIAYSDTEPDAENYLCDNCGEEEVYGIENLLIMGHIQII